MNIVNQKTKLTLSLVFLSQLVDAQAGSGSSYFLYALIGIGLFLLVFAVLSLADNLIQIEGQKMGVDNKKNDLGIFPKINTLLSKKAPEFVSDEAGYYPLKKGFTLKLAGEAEGAIRPVRTNRYALKPTDFRHLSNTKSCGSCGG